MKTWVWAVLAAILVAGGGLFWALLPDRNLPPDIRAAKREFDAEWKKAVALGLDQPYGVPLSQPIVRPDQNAAQYLSDLQGATREQEELLRILRPFSPDRAAPVSIEDLEPCAATMERARQGANLPFLVFDFQEDWDAWTSYHATGIWDVHTLILGRAKAYALAGQPHEAADDLITAYRLIQLVAQLGQPATFHFFMMANNSLKALSEVLPQIDDPQIVARLSESLPEEFSPDLAGHLHQIIRYDLRFLRHPELYGGPEKMIATQSKFPSDEDIDWDEMKTLNEWRTGPPENSYAQAFTARYLQTMLPLLDPAPHEPPNQVFEKVDKAKKETGPSWAYIRSYHSETKSSIQPLFNAHWRLRLAKIIASAYENRLRTGHWPRDLAQMNLEYTDPFTGAPLTYEVRSTISFHTRGAKDWSDLDDLRYEFPESKS